MKLGTHNSMSYLPPKKWYMKPFRFMAQCLSKNILEQYDLGARMFDLRIKYDNLKPEFRHGSMAFKGDVLSVLDQLNKLKGPIYVRLLLETSKVEPSQEILFIKDCAYWLKKYTNLNFFCGRRKFDWKLIYKFPLDDLDIDLLVSSMDNNKLNDLYPKAYAKKHNKENLKNYKGDKWVTIDFIEIQ